MKNGYIGKDENNKLRRMRRKSRIYWEEIIRINWEKREEYI